MKSGNSSPHVDASPSTTPLVAHYASLFRLARLARKELAEILRDRRTMVTLIFMPVLVYPLLSVLLQQFLIVGHGSAKKVTEYKIAFNNEVEEAVFRNLMELGDQALEERAKEVGDAGHAKIKWKSYQPDDLDRAVEEGSVQFGVRMLGSKRVGSRDRVVDFEFRYLAAQPDARAFLDHVERRLAAAQSNLLESRLGMPGLPPATAVRIVHSPMPVPGADNLISLSALVPLILILMTITGAVYPAIDLTAGERERGTLEILVAAPVPRLGLLLAKYVCVVTVAILTGLVNLTSMVITLTFIPLGIFGEQGLTVRLVIEVFGLLVLFAAFFSAVLLCLTSFARSFKEAQAYLIPLMLLSLGPGLIGMMPGLRLADWAAAPLLNIVLLGRDLLDGHAELAPAIVVVVTTILYALAAISLAARVFGSESVLYSDQGNWGDLWRRPPEQAANATRAAAMWCLALVIPIYFFARALASSSLLLPVGQLVVVTGLALSLFGLWPALVAYRGHVRWQTGFGLMRPHAAAWPGALLLGVSLWPLVLQGLSWVRGNHLEGLRQQLEAAGPSPFPPGSILVYVFAASLVIQAACEEWLFRGLLFRAIQARFGALLTIGGTALLFGLTHVVLGGPLGLERMLPSTVLGLVLGWIAWTTDSLWPGILTHGCHNAMLILVGNQLKSIPATWLVLAAVGIAVGIFLVRLAGVKPRSKVSGFDPV